ncbi:MAG: MobA/MobL family protein [Prevotella sp.]|nr:MobA/MobL family protein [Prevotella sp.]
MQRSKGQSAVAAAAYQSGDRLFCEYDQKTKHYRNKKEVVFSTILTPPHAPPELTDRNTLWNSVERTETRYNSQLARRIVMALPKEIPKEQQIQLVREYCQEQFVSKGMIADIAVHDKGDGNPHAHILLTMRPVDEKGNWAPKSRMVYDLDENGKKQKTAKGNWKCHKEPTVDWNDRKYAEIWRHEWEGLVNRYYAENGLEERVDLRSYRPKIRALNSTAGSSPRTSRKLSPATCWPTR